MASPFFGIELGSRALKAFQTALDVTGHNMANVNTRGYSRQRANMSATLPDTALGQRSFQLGTGVSIDSVKRIRDLFVDQRYRSANSDASRSSTLNDQLKQIEAIFSEPGNPGLSTQMDAFFNALQTLSTDPSNASARAIVRDKADALARNFRTLNSVLNDKSQELNGQIEVEMKNINSLATKIADLNKQIALSTASGSSPNDLMDQRDLLIEQLSGMVDIDVRQGQNSTLDVFVGEVTLVRADKASPLPSTLDATAGTLTDGVQTIKLTGGSLSGMVEAQKLLNGYQKDFNTLASSLITRVNAVHQAGTTTAGVTNIPFFKGTDARNIDLSDQVRADVSNIVAGTAPTGQSAAAGDGSQALALAQLRSETQTTLGSNTFSEYFNRLVTRIGEDSNYSASSLETQSAVVSQLDNLRESVSGVNLDEEMSNMMRYQRAYQAAARFINMADSLLQETIEQLGR